MSKLNAELHVDVTAYYVMLCNKAEKPEKLIALALYQHSLA